MAMGPAASGVMKVRASPCPSQIVGGFAVACARRGREQGEREPGEHLLVGFW